MSALVIYIPAIHNGYIDFLKMHRDMQIFLLDLSLVRKNDLRMERDIRALNTKDVLSALKSIGFENINILTEKDIPKIKDKKLLFLDEDVSHSFIDKYLKGKKDIKFTSLFLRWDKHASLKKNIVIPNRKISKNDFDKEILKEAHKEALKSPDWWRQVGAIVIKNNKILLKGFNRPLESLQTHNIFGDPRSNFDYGVSFELSKFIHAEASIIAESAKRGIKLEGASIYITTFPCPVCAKSIAVAGIKKVYYSDGYSLLDAEDILKHFGVEIIRVEESKE